MLEERRALRLVKVFRVRARQAFIEGVLDRKPNLGPRRGALAPIEHQQGIESFQKPPGDNKIDLSKIDFEALAKRFEKKRPTNSDLERLKAAVRAQLERMVRLNHTRADYLEKFQALIDDYNNGSRNIEEIFRDLVALSRVLTEEQGRHVREHLSEEELTTLDILTQQGPELSMEERDEVKKVAQQLLARLNELLVLGWRQKIQSRARVRIAIEDTLGEGLPRAYSDELYKKKSEVLFEHVYESYMGEGASVYADVAWGRVAVG